MERKLVGMMFSDVSGYSSLKEPQLRVFIETVLQEIAEVLNQARNDCLEINTWGDAIVAASADPYKLAHVALDLRDYFKNKNWEDSHLPSSLACRIALHAGVVFIGDDPIRQRPGIVGTQVNLAARIEPVTTPGEVWVTEQFAKMIAENVDKTIGFDDLGERPLAKKFGSARLFRLRRSHETAPAPNDMEVPPTTPAKTHIPRDLEIAIHMAKHGSEEQRKVGLDLLDQFNTAESVETLLEVARDKASPHLCRRMAIASLDRLKSRTAVPDLISIVQDDTEMHDMIGSSVEALGEIRDVRALPVFDTLLLGNRILEAGIIRQAILATAKIGDPAGIKILRKIFDHMDAFLPFFGQLATAAAILPDPSFVIPLQDILRRKEQFNSERRLTALSSLLLINPEQSEDLFIEIAKDEKELHEIRFTAIGALAAVPSTKSRRVLEEIAADLGNPLAARAMVVLVKGAALLKKQKDEFVNHALGKK